jgi:hypothetical protein
MCKYASGASATTGNTFAYRTLLNGMQIALTDDTKLPEHVYSLTDADGVAYVQYI